MKQFFQNIIHAKYFWLSLIIILQTLVYIWAGASKSYLHMDEIYSYGLSNYDHVQIYEDDHFYDTWHTPAYYDDFLTVNDDERWNFQPVYENQKNDVHPPFFYLLLRLGMELTPNHFSKWTGIILNLIVAAISTVILFWVIEKLLRREPYAQTKSLILTLVVALSLSTISTVVYIRMYELLTLWILLTAYLHIKLLESEKLNPKLLVGIGATAFLGVMTQYYYLFFLVALFGYFTVRYAKQKRWREWRWYFASLAVAGGLSLIIFPYSLQHLFFSNRGAGVLSTLTQPLVLLSNLWKYFGVIDKYVFHFLLILAVAGLIYLGARALWRQKVLKLSYDQQNLFVMLLVPTVFYLVIVAAASPFTELRYIAPVCGFVIILSVYALYQLFRLCWTERTSNFIMAGILVFSGIFMPIAAQIEPDTVYHERGQVLAEVKDYHQAPALYITRGEGDWNFLNDLLIFRELDESYVVKDLKGTEKEIDQRLQQILQGHSLEHGLLVFVTDEYDQTHIMRDIERATGLNSATHLARMVTSDIFYLQREEI